MNPLDNIIPDLDEKFNKELNTGEEGVVNEQEDYILGDYTLNDLPEVEGYPSYSGGNGPDEGYEQVEDVDPSEIIPEPYLVNERFELKDLMGQASAFMEEGYELSIKYGTNHRGNHIYIKGDEDFKEKVFRYNDEQRGFMIYLHLHGTARAANSLVCIDIDSQGIWDRMTSPEGLPMLGKTLACHSRRGGHLFYRLGNESEKNKPGAVGMFGGEMDWLTNNVTFIGPGKSLLNNQVHVRADELDTPPLPLRLNLAKNRTARLFDKEYTCVNSGERNDKLFRWANNLVGSYEEKLEIAKFTNKLFFVPPLPEDELERTVKQLPEGVEQQKADVARSNEIAAYKIREDRKILKRVLENEFRYDYDKQRWLKFNGKFWVEILESEMVFSIEEAILTTASQLKTAVTTSNPRALALNHIHSLKRDMLVSEDLRKTPPGFNKFHEACLIACALPDQNDPF